VIPAAVIFVVGASTLAVRTTPAVLTPEAEAFFRIYEPLQDAGVIRYVRPLPRGRIVEGDSPGRTTLGALLAPLAELPNAERYRLIAYQRHVGEDLGEPDAGAILPGYEQPLPSRLA